MSNVSLLIFGSCLLSLLYGVYAIRAVLAAPTGTERMQQIALAIQEGASAYLARQYKTIAIVGPSGCGKSTLPKAIVGLWPITSGTIRVDGSEVRGPLNIVGMAFQNATLLPWRNPRARYRRRVAL